MYDLKYKLDQKIKPNIKPTNQKSKYKYINCAVGFLSVEKAFKLSFFKARPT